MYYTTCIKTSYLQLGTSTGKSNEKNTSVATLEYIRDIKQIDQTLFSLFRSIVAKVLKTHVHIVWCVVAIIRPVEIVTWIKQIGKSIANQLRRVKTNSIFFSFFRKKTLKKEEEKIEKRRIREEKKRVSSRSRFISEIVARANVSVLKCGEHLFIQSRLLHWLS